MSKNISTEIDELLVGFVDELSNRKLLDKKEVLEFTKTNFMLFLKIICEVNEHDKRLLVLREQLRNTTDGQQMQKIQSEIANLRLVMRPTNQLRHDLRNHNEYEGLKLFIKERLSPEILMQFYSVMDLYVKQ